MRLDHRHIRFTTPQLTIRRPNLIRLGGSRGSLNLLETALIAEGELMRFSFLGTEWMFRRALSEWTAVTVPYSRITAVRYSRLVAFRVISILAVASGIAASATLLWGLDDQGLGLLTAAYTVGMAAFLGFLNWWIKPYCRVNYRGKDGRSYLLAFTFRTKRLRKPFLDALAAHRAAAGQYAPAIPVGTGR